MVPGRLIRDKSAACEAEMGQSQIMKGTPLVLLHGYPFDHSMWDKVVARFEPDRRFLAPDLRGFGIEPGPFEPSVEQMADDVAQQLPTAAVIAGFSMGGYVALALAEKYPQLVCGLALVNSQALADTDEVRQGRRVMIEKVRERGVEAALEAAIPKLFANSSTELHRYPTLGAQRAGVAGITWALEAMARRPDRTTVARRLGKPILIVHSTEDKFIPAARARELANSLPAKYVEIERAGHCTPLEAPEKVAAALKEFVDGC
jgi:pimeloyl-ACP methyl ester carboxylesterase